jgi:hypothetical protein
MLYFPGRGAVDFGFTTALRNGAAHEASTRRTTRFVTLRTEEQLDMQAISGPR